MTRLSAQKPEHRIDKRKSITFPVFIHGFTENGERIKTNTITDNISPGGLFLQTPQALKLGSAIFTFTQLFNGTRLAAQGAVVRIEKKKHGLSGFAVCFSHFRLIPT